MKQFYLLLSIVVFLTSISCRRVFTLSEKDTGFINYTGHEDLIFMSKSGNSDTFKLAGYNRYLSTESGKGLNTKAHIEHYNLMYEFYDGSFALQKNKSEIYLVALTARENGNVIISFNIMLPLQGYYFWNAFNLDSFYSEKLMPLNIDGSIVTDALLIENKAKNTNNSAVKLNISKIYWSKSRGLVAYEVCNNAVSFLFCLVDRKVKKIGK